MVTNEQTATEIGLSCSLFRDNTCPGGDCVACTTTVRSRLKAFLSRLASPNRREFPTCTECGGDLDGTGSCSTVCGKTEQREVARQSAYIRLEQLATDAIIFEVINPFRILLGVLAIVLLGNLFNQHRLLIIGNVLALVAPLILLVILGVVGAFALAISGNDEEGSYEAPNEPMDVQDQMARLQLEENLQQMKGGGMAG